MYQCFAGFELIGWFCGIFSSFQSRARKKIFKTASNTLIFTSKNKAIFPTLFILHQSPYLRKINFSLKVQPEKFFQKIFLKTFNFTNKINSTFPQISVTGFSGLSANISIFLSFSKITFSEKIPSKPFIFTIKIR